MARAEAGSPGRFAKRAGQRGWQLGQQSGALNIEGKMHGMLTTGQAVF